VSLPLGGSHWRYGSRWHQRRT